MKNGGCGVPFEYHLRAICAGESENSRGGCEVLGCSEYGGALQEPGVPFGYHLRAICAGESENSRGVCEVLGCIESV